MHYILNYEEINFKKLEIYVLTRGAFDFQLTNNELMKKIKN
jgi:hypothetical protein